jgi:hypothetical protein
MFVKDILKHDWPILLSIAIIIATLAGEIIYGR